METEISGGLIKRRGRAGDPRVNEKDSRGGEVRGFT